MKPEGHFEKAIAFEQRAEKMDTDLDAPSVIEDLFDAMVHHIAYGINIGYGTDLDSHGKQKRFLREKELHDLLEDYNELERLRIGSVYGSKWNGDRVDKAKMILKRVKQWSMTIGGPG